jgi:hypothetical protein
MKKLLTTKPAAREKLRIPNGKSQKEIAHR